MTFLSKNLHISRKSSTFALAIGTKRTHRLFIETYKPIQTNIVILQYVGGNFLWCNTRAKPARKGSVQFFFIKTDRYSSVSRAQPTHFLAKDIAFPCMSPRAPAHTLRPIAAPATAHTRAFRFYLDTFRNGMPPHGGFAIGLERITACFLGIANVKECSMFPRDINRVAP